MAKKHPVRYQPMEESFRRVTAKLPGTNHHNTKPGSSAKVSFTGKIVSHTMGEYGEGPSTTFEVEDSKQNKSHITNKRKRKHNFVPVGTSSKPRGKK